MADSDPTPPPRRSNEPDVGMLVVGIAGAALTTMGTLAVVATQPIGYIIAAGVVPVLFWAWLLRMIHGLLRFDGPDRPEGAWLPDENEPDGHEPGDAPAAAGGRDLA
jgi:hypothetical protein